jgi:hypothetical protein
VIVRLYADNPATVGVKKVGDAGITGSHIGNRPLIDAAGNLMKLLKGYLA